MSDRRTDKRASIFTGLLAKGGQRQPWLLCRQNTKQQQQRQRQKWSGNTSFACKSNSKIELRVGQTASLQSVRERRSLAASKLQLAKQWRALICFLRH